MAAQRSCQSEEGRLAVSWEAGWDRKGLEDETKGSFRLAVYGGEGGFESELF